MIEEIARWEAKMNGQFFFTDQRIPLQQVIKQIQAVRAAQGNIFDDAVEFGCGNGVCGV